MIGDELVEDVNLVDTNEEKEKALADGTAIIIDGRMICITLSYSHIVFVMRRG